MEPIGEDKTFQLHRVSQQIKDSYFCLDDVVWRKRPDSIKKLVGKIYDLYNVAIRQIIHKRVEIERDREND